MPLVGTRSVDAFNGGPLVSQLDAETWTLPGCGILQLMYEVDAEAMTSLLPPALHPTIPPTVVLTVTNIPESPAGAFVLAEAKVGSRSGARPRGLLVSGFASTQAGADAFASRWGYPLKVADVSLMKRYDRVVGTVSMNGKTVLDMTLLNPEPIAGNDIQYLANLNTARIKRDGAEVARLIQSDPDYVFRSADRGKPHLEAFDAAAFGIDGAVPVYPVSASYAVADISMPEIRYLVDPAKPPLASVERI
jgi:hypothetical protein